MPNAVQDSGAVLGNDGNIYVTGGTDIFGDELTSTYLFDVGDCPDTCTWTAMSDLNQGRDSLGSAVDANGVIYAVGGNNSTGVTYQGVAYMEEYY
jgi:hypothetical protein